MTMLETKKALEDSLFNRAPLSFDAMMNCYVAVQNFLAGCGDKDITVDINVSENLKDA